MFSILFVIIFLLVMLFFSNKINIKQSQKKILTIIFLVFIIIDIIVATKIINNNYNNNNNSSNSDNNISSDDDSNYSNNYYKYNYTESIIKILKVEGSNKTIIYEDDEFYKPIKSEYYSEESKKIYVYYDTSKVEDGDYDFTNPLINREVQSLGFKEFKIVNNISKVPKQSTLILFLSSPFKSGTSYYKELKSTIGYDNYKNQAGNKNITDYYGDQRKLKTYSRVYIIGRSNEFSSFHMDLDQFLPSQRQYKIIEHPIRFMETSHLSLFVKLASLNPASNYSKITMKFERQQFPINRYTDNNGNQIVPTDQQCAAERSFVAELQEWGLISIIHINIYMFLMGGFSNRMYIMQHGNFLYGSFNHLFLPVSICDYYNYDQEGLKKYQINTTLNIRDYDQDNIIFMSRGRHFASHYTNFVPPEHIENFPTNFAGIAFYMDYFLTPNYQLREYVNQEILETFKLPYGMPKRCISVHIRHGDKVSEADIFSFKEYVAILKTMKTGIKDVFIMSDDKSVIDESLQLNKEKGAEFHFHSLPNINRMENNNERNDKSWDPNIPKSQYAYQFYAEAMIASRCEIFVGTLSSNIGRLIPELQAVYQPFTNTTLRYVSLDLSYPKNSSYIPQTKH